MVFGMLYTQHGGSGLTGLSYTELLELSLDEVEWYAERLDAQRSREAAAIRSAGKGK